MIKILTYYIIIPVIVLGLCWKLWTERRYLNFTSYKKSKFGDLKTSVKNLEELQVYFVIVLLISIPVLHVVTSEIVDEHAHVSKISSPSVKGGGGLGEIDPVRFEIEPTYDIEEVKEKMEKDPGRFRPGLVYDVTDIDEMTRFPGRMAVYRLRNSRILVTYTYISPYPIVKAFAITLFPDNPNVSPIVEEETFVYPESPSTASNFNKIG